MASTPKPARRAIKRARRDASRFLGVPVKARVKKGERTEHEPRVKGKKLRSIVRLEKGLFRSKAGLKELSRAARHEFFHSGHDLYMFKKAVLQGVVVSEAIAIVGDAEFDLARNPKAYNKYVGELEYQLAMIKFGVEPTENPAHPLALPIAINILKKFPKRRERKEFIRQLIRENSRVLSKGKKGDQFTLDNLGRVILKKQVDK